MFALARQRRLYLRLSALSNDEYEVFFSALKDILDVQDASGDSKTVDEAEEHALECREVSSREVRAWMKGRFHSVDPNDIDKVCSMSLIFHYEF